MRLMKRTGIYKASNCTFNPATCEAHSYGWWRFVAIVEGKTIASSYRYSNSTSKHQRKVASLMSQLGIKVDHYLQLPHGIRAGQSLQELFTIAEETLCDQLLAEAAKRDERNERARMRRLAKQQQLDEQFKANVERISYADVLQFRASKAGAV